MAITPMQKPHPPIWFASHSPRATRRAARAADGCLLGPQTAWEDISALAAIYWETREASDHGPAGMLGMHRCVAMSTDRETAASEARAVGERKGSMYGGWGMQENSVVDLGLDRKRPLDEWTILGSPSECLEKLARCEEEDRVQYAGLTFINFPAEHSARMEYLQRFSEEVVRKLPGG